MQKHPWNSPGKGTSATGAGVQPGGPDRALVSLALWQIPGPFPCYSHPSFPLHAGAAAPTAWAHRHGTARTAQRRAACGTAQGRAMAQQSRAEQRWQGWGLEERGGSQQAMAGAESQGPAHRAACPSKPTPVWPHLAPGCTGSRMLRPMALSILELGGRSPKRGSAGRSSAPRPGLSH